MADSGQNRQMRIRGWARACVAEPACLRVRFGTSPGHSQKGKARVVHGLQDGALASG